MQAAGCRRVLLSRPHLFEGAKMTRFNNPLKHVRIASPCNADWDQMIGNERARFCGQCSLNVYNLSSLGRREAEQLISQNEGRLCIRYYRRTDGSIITRNCPVGLRALKRRLKLVARAIASAVLSFFAGVGFYDLLVPPSREFVMGLMAVEPQPRLVTMGEIVAPKPSQPPAIAPPVGRRLSRKQFRER